LKLARTLGMTYRECRERVDAAELELWRAEDRIEPIDGWGQAGAICSTVAGSRGVRIDPDAFIPGRAAEVDDGRERIGGADLEAHHRAVYG